MLVLVVIGVDKRGAESCLGGLTIFAVFAVRAVFAIFAVWAVP